ncbi:MAG: diguanylate cyclase [Clostridia bacterium]|nr:diguanylate cyclase [Clostridia bacterium]
MSVFSQLLKPLKAFKREIKIHHFNTFIKKIEFFFYVGTYFSLGFMLSTSMIPRGYVQIIAQFEAFIALFLAFRFRYLGLMIAVSLSLFELPFILSRYLEQPNLSDFAGLTNKVLTILSSILVAILSNNQEMQKRKMEWLSITDKLTNVYNQRFFISALENEIETAKKNNGTLGLILIDIDNFKMYNDIYGHDFGDTLLKGTGAILKEVAGNHNILCRNGGDEFAIILPGNSLDLTKQTAHKIRSEFERLKVIYFEKSSGSKITLSMGLSVYPDMANSKDELFTQADMALYHAKNLGKDKIHLYQDIILQIRKNISSDHHQLIEVFRTLLTTISAKDKYTLGHSERVASYAIMTGEALGLNLKEISTLQYASLLHDIGKIEIPKSILNKVEPLSDEEFNLIRKHPVYSANILEPLGGMDQLIDFVLHHHERFDGRGYPHGLSGNQISLGARILCVADSYDAMLSERPYSKGMPVEEAFRELERCAGSQFDPDVVKVFISIMKENSYKRVV